VGGAVYQEFASRPGLTGVVRAEWERGARPADGEILVLPDGCVDLVWRSDGVLFVAGPDLGPVVHRHPLATGFVGFRLQPGAAASVLGVAADELRDLQLPLAELWGRAAGEHAEQLAHAGTDHERRALLARVLRARITPEHLDEAVLAAARTLECGPLRVTDVAERVGLSDRSLHRRFVRQVGYGPKTFARVMRLRRFLALGADAGGGGLATLAAESGYADQAHLTRECRRLTGRTPSELLVAA
jgi:AraC-like DNA-binding protein